jgi:hypothetical protein
MAIEVDAFLVPFLGVMTVKKETERNEKSRALYIPLRRTGPDQPSLSISLLEASNEKAKRRHSTVTTSINIPNNSPLKERSSVSQIIASTFLVLLDSRPQATSHIVNGLRFFFPSRE